jgi:hypothetical protein
LHRTIACFDCHRSGNFAAITGSCAGCHIDDAPAGHAADRRDRCAGAGCHNANSWTNRAAALPRDSVCR